MGSTYTEDELRTFESHYPWQGNRSPAEITKAIRSYRDRIKTLTERSESQAQMLKLWERDFPVCSNLKCRRPGAVYAQGRRICRVCSKAGRR